MSDEPDGRGQGPPLEALVSLLRRTHLAPPDLIPDAVDAAIAHLDVRGVVFLADYSDTVLVPMARDRRAEPETLAVDATLAGRAYRLLTVQTTLGDGVPTLWVPIIDGVERLGVLQVTVGDAGRLGDEGLLNDLWSFAHFLGHLVSVLDAYGDAIDTVRRQTARTLSAELIWQLLPPLTSGTAKVVVSGRLEPSSEVGGDVFDYALSADRAQFAVFDATGHDLHSGLAAATALAAYRNSRREGHGLFEQTEAVHRAVGDEFAGRMYATGVLGDLDLDTGRLRYIAAGHPSPLLLRRGRVVKTLDSGRRPLLGLDMKAANVAEEWLEPDDVLVLYTDGITEARNTDHQFFGVDRLVDFVEREAADGVPLPEIVRRVGRRILEHQNGVLQDDATILLIQWTSSGQEALEPMPEQGPPQPRTG